MRRPVPEPPRSIPPPANPDDATPRSPESGAYMLLDSDDIEDLIASGACWMPVSGERPVEQRTRSGAFAKAA